MTGIAPRFAWLPGKMRRSSSRLPSQLLYVVGWFCAQLVWVVRDDLVGATVRLVDGRRRLPGVERRSALYSLEAG